MANNVNHETEDGEWDRTPDNHYVRFPCRRTNMRLKKDIDKKQSDFITQAAFEREQQRQINESQDAELHHRLPTSAQEQTSDDSYTWPEEMMDRNDILQDLTTSVLRPGGPMDVEESLAEIVGFVRRLRSRSCSAPPSLPGSLCHFDATTRNQRRCASDPGCHRRHQRTPSSTGPPVIKRATSEPAPFRSSEDEAYSEARSEESMRECQAGSEEAWSTRQERSRPASPLGG